MLHLVSQIVTGSVFTVSQEAVCPFVYLCTSLCSQLFGFIAIVCFQTAVQDRKLHPMMEQVVGEGGGVPHPLLWMDQGLKDGICHSF